eukprot:TRINITY_DN5814_c0_g4_i2.p2 TRINITY_DN5814_c0_g4~~TRINITY_DN5814_c0_g4_i2.p2  ORF type:complete len:149 (-),score=23.82 TRINITY_DN5814_c0_g4_i2:508-954(-)
MQVTAASLYAIPEQLRRYSTDTSLSPQPHPAPAYCPKLSAGYFPQEIPAGRSRILSFSEGKRKGDLLDFYVKYKTEVRFVGERRCARTGKGTGSASLANAVPSRMEKMSCGKKSILHRGIRRRSARASTKMVSALMVLAVNSFMMRWG